MSQLSSVSSGGGGGAGTVTSVSGGNNITITGVPTVNPTVNVSGTTNFAVQIGNAGGSLTSVALGTAGQVLTSNGAGVAPTFQSGNLAATCTFFAYKTNAQGTQTIASGATDIVAFGGTTINVGAAYSTATSKFTTPVTGTYFFCFKLSCLAANDSFGDQAFFTVNDNTGAVEYYSTVNPATNFAAEPIIYTALISLTAGDLVDVYYRNNSAGISDSFVGFAPSAGQYPTVFMGYRLI